MLNLRLKNSDQDNKLDTSYIEFDIFTLWKIDILNLIKSKAVLAKNFHIQPSEIDKMPMWEYEIFMEAINDLVKEENKEQQSQMDKYGANNAMKTTNLNNINKMQKFATPKIPNFNIPKF